ncbi:MICAL-like protein 1 [Protopterus annectens]|uniref:MICAL-like protein 1 n=1 Tax=Protopterus annectens TaxID=7888 RepID=UPI001CFC250A|nr:MICAL-like protein 1 [Protopterus annectens]
MSATRALQEWCRLQCQGYPNVEIKNMNSSFKDGLAFCAIIHKHRPDLIDFSSLSKENVYENNRLAFEVAEQELGIPALLDPDDMVAMKIPDRLSIMTYVSQYYNYFTNQNHAEVPLSMKRPAAASPSEPAVKRPITAVEKVLTPKNDLEERPQRTTLSSTCAICQQHVHLVQRHLVDGKLYHRSCFRCKECYSTLRSGSYKPGVESGTFICVHHRERFAGNMTNVNQTGLRKKDGCVLGSQDKEISSGTEANVQEAPLAADKIRKELARSNIVRRLSARFSGDHNACYVEKSGESSNRTEIKMSPDSKLVSNIPSVEGSGDLSNEADIKESLDTKSVSGSVMERINASSSFEPEVQATSEIKPISDVPSIERTCLFSSEAEVKELSESVSSVPPIERNGDSASCKTEGKVSLETKPLSNEMSLESISDFRESLSAALTSVNQQNDQKLPLTSQPAFKSGVPEKSLLFGTEGEANQNKPAVAATSQDSKSVSDALKSDLKIQESRPVPAPRRTSDATVFSPSVCPTPKPRSGHNVLGEIQGEEKLVLNEGPAESSVPVPKPRERQKQVETKGSEKPKDPPWIVLVQSEQKRRPPPPPPSQSRMVLPKAVDEGKHSIPMKDEEKASAKISNVSETQPKPINPFEDEEEEEISEASESSGKGEKTFEEEKGDTTLKPNHPWYGITPTSSPRTKKRLAPKAPHASPQTLHMALHPSSRLSHSEPPSSTPSPALSVESISSESSLKWSSEKGQRSSTDLVSKSSSEPEIRFAIPASIPISGTTNLVGHSSVENATSSESSDYEKMVPTSSKKSSSTELINENTSPGSQQTIRTSPSSSPKSNPSRPPPKPPTTRNPVAVHFPNGSNDPVSSPSPKPQSKTSCKENPFNRKASPVTSPSKSSTPKGPKPPRPPAPGHGFPLIKRKVQSDQYIPEEDIQDEMEQIEQQLDELEHRGVDLEQKLRSCENDDDDEDNLLIEWFKLIHEKHMLVRRESELVYTAKQQNLEERQADVEYELRCLLNKPEKDWTEDDRLRERDLMDELVTIIEQRNAIINTLEEDRQREEEEDKILEAMIKKKDFHKDPDSEARRKGKFKPMKVLKLLSNKDMKSKSPKDKN